MCLRQICNAFWRCWNQKVTDTLTEWVTRSSIELRIIINIIGGRILFSFLENGSNKILNLSLNLFSSKSIFTSIDSVSQKKCLSEIEIMTGQRRVKSFIQIPHIEEHITGPGLHDCWHRRCSRSRNSLRGIYYPLHSIHSPVRPVQYNKLHPPHGLYFPTPDDPGWQNLAAFRQE